MTKTNTISAEVIAAAEALSILLENDYNVSFKTLDRLFKQAGFKVKIGSGAYRYAVIFDGGVLKMSRDQYRLEELRKECAFINEMRTDSKYGRHFPETHLVEIGEVPVLVQEKINMNHEDKWSLENDVERLATHLGIDDMHDGNYGWKGEPGREYE